MATDTYHSVLALIGIALYSNVKVNWIKFRCDISSKTVVDVSSLLSLMMLLVARVYTAI